MLKEMLFYNSIGGYSGGAFEKILIQWEQMGVFSYMLPFLLIFALIYGILSKMKLFGDSGNKQINGIIALATSLMSLQFNIVNVFFSDIFPRLGIAMAGVLVMLILIGLFGNPNNKALINTMMWSSFGIAILIILQSLEIFNLESGRSLLGFIPAHWVPMIALIVMVGIIIASAVKQTDTTPAGHLVKAFGGND